MASLSAIPLESQCSRTKVGVVLFLGRPAGLFPTFLVQRSLPSAGSLELSGGRMEPGHECDAD